MEIKKLKLVNFRNYDSLELNFNKKNTIFIGNNAQGKTNILESIYVLGLTKSFFNINDKNLIKFGESYSKIQGSVLCDNIEKKLEILINEKEKKVKIDNQELTKLSNYISKLNVIVFSPDNIRLLKESPGYRRRYLNIEISQLYSDYIILLNDFNKVLKQRNEYLKIISNNKNYDEIYLDILNRKYASLAVSIYLYRNKYINDVNSKLGNIYKKITNFDNLKIKYVSNIDYDASKDKMIEKFLDKLNTNFNRELFYKITLYGPHRDDFQLELSEKNILLYGSQGQIRCAVLALKFAEIPIFKETLGVTPILLLDDIFSELDSKKKNLIIDFIPSDIQSFITTTDLDSVDKKILSDSDVYVVDNGKINFFGQDERKVI